MALQGKVFAITGAGQGIALATARVLASRGASVSLADNNQATLEEVEKEFRGKNWPVITAVIDVRNGKQVDGWITKTVQEFGRLDGAANIAGVIGKQFGKALVADIDDDDWELVMGINVTGTMNSLRAELRHLADGGSIVNVASNLGSRGEARASAYATSKHAVIGLTKCAAREYGSRGIRVNTVAPGPTRTPLFDNVVQGNPPPPDSVLGRYGKPEEIAFAIAWLLGPESTNTTGELFRIDGGEFC
ncbi:hypothetical protein LCI18_003178 [Fusarium solani-melongenae]|uniref:Uncharacterized protein n=1 Tax=Fusarium solani subsp. cucurbitae TaxID=2747967 RepID=A0ACD3YTE1_FUSSC|nr:hypothetical protein LCI18_003178 [Fusarium solani-melongenae]